MKNYSSKCPRIKLKLITADAMITLVGLALVLITKAITPGSTPYLIALGILLFGVIRFVINITLTILAVKNRRR